MNFLVGITIYLLTFLLLFFVFYRMRMGLFSIITCTALISALILLLIVPFSEIDDQLSIYFKDKPHNKCYDWLVIIYLLIMTLTLILISAYIIYKSYEDRQFDQQII